MKTGPAMSGAGFEFLTALLFGYTVRLVRSMMQRFAARRLEEMGKAKSTSKLERAIRYRLFHAIFDAFPAELFLKLDARVPREKPKYLPLPKTRERCGFVEFHRSLPMGVRQGEKREHLNGVRYDFIQAWFAMCHTASACAHAQGGIVTLNKQFMVVQVPPPVFEKDSVAKLVLGGPEFVSICEEYPTLGGALAKRNMPSWFLWMILYSGFGFHNQRFSEAILAAFAKKLQRAIDERGRGLRVSTEFIIRPATGIDDGAFELVHSPLPPMH